MTLEPRYRYSNLTKAIADKHSPLRQYFDSRFPNTKAVQAEYKAEAGPLLVDGGTSAAGTVGAAFDFMVRTTLDNAYVPQVALDAFKGNADYAGVVAEVARIGGEAVKRSENSAPPRVAIAASWVLALCTEIYRIGGLHPGSPLAPLLSERRFRTGDLLELVPDDAVAQLSDLHDVAVQRLYPHLQNPVGSLALGPSFTASALCKADADLIVDGLLIDLKTHLGSRHKSSGVRSDGLVLAEIYQLIGYVLFDRSDEFGITSLGLYSARFGYLRTWGLTNFLSELATTEVDVASEREAVWAVLGGR